MESRENDGNDLPNTFGYSLPPLDFQSAMILELVDRDDPWWCDREASNERNQQLAAEILNLHPSMSSELRQDAIQKHRDTAGKITEPSGLNTPEFVFPEGVYELSSTLFDIVNPPQPPIQPVTQEEEFRSPCLDWEWEMDPLPIEPEDVKPMEVLDNAERIGLKEFETDSVAEDAGDESIVEMKESDVDNVAEIKELTEDSSEVVDEIPTDAMSDIKVELLTEVKAENEMEADSLWMEADEMEMEAAEPKIEPQEDVKPPKLVTKIRSKSKQPKLEPQEDVKPPKLVKIRPKRMPKLEPLEDIKPPTLKMEPIGEQPKVEPQEGVKPPKLVKIRPKRMPKLEPLEDIKPPTLKMEPIGEPQDDIKPLTKIRRKRKEPVGLRNVIMSDDDGDYTLEQEDKEPLPIAPRPDATAQELAFQETLEDNTAFKSVTIDNGPEEPIYPTLQDGNFSYIKGIFSCKYCLREFLQRYKWRNHVKIHIGTTVHKCSCVKCGEVPYRDLRTLRKNHNLHYK